MLRRDNDSGCCFENKKVHINEIGGDIIEFLCRAKKKTYAGKGSRVWKCASFSRNPHNLALIKLT
ncbi:MAG: hypothetical protein ACRCWA_10310, partial [Clostridium butyricum]